MGTTAIGGIDQTVDRGRVLGVHLVHIVAAVDVEQHMVALPIRVDVQHRHALVAFLGQLAVKDLGVGGISGLASLCQRLEGGFDFLVHNFIGSQEPFRGGGHHSAPVGDVRKRAECGKDQADGGYGADRRPKYPLFMEQDEG